MTTRGFFRSLLGAVVAGRMRADDEKAPTRTEGKENGRFWMEMSDSNRTHFVIGVSDAIDDVVSSFEVLLAEDQRGIDFVKKFKAKAFSLSSFGEIKQEINRLYADPANAIIPVVDVFYTAQKRLQGSTNDEVENRLVFLRKLYTDYVKQESAK